MQVSWFRTRDLHLLTVGRFTYTSDDRFKAVHQKGSDDWLLKIHYVQHRDAGRYECQVSTTPPLSYSVYLSVVGRINITHLLPGGFSDRYIHIHTVRKIWRGLTELLSFCLVCKMDAVLLVKSMYFHTLSHTFTHICTHVQCVRVTLFH